MKGERTKQYLRHLRRGRGGALYLILIKEQGLRVCLLHAFLGKLPTRQQILTPQALKIGRLGAASGPGKLSGRQSKQALNVCLLGTLANMPGAVDFVHLKSGSLPTTIFEFRPPSKHTINPRFQGLYVLLIWLFLLVTCYIAIQPDTFIIYVEGPYIHWHPKSLQCKCFLYLKKWIFIFKFPRCTPLWFLVYF
jgi:hypothetical protein